jgi:DNA-binding transcriptional ArsR family regulator
MKKRLFLQTTAQWKALGHPLRASILRLLTERAMTNEQMAEALGVESGKLYFHTKQLLDAEMIEVTETRTRGTIVEKFYRAVALQYVADGLPDTTSREVPLFDGLLSDALWLYRKTWQETPGLNRKTHYAFHFTHRLDPGRMQEFVRHMKALVAEFQDARTENPEDLEYSFALLLHAIPGSDEPSSKG